MLHQDTGAISIHALLAESDRSRTARAAHWQDFYPRSPCGERLVPDSLERAIFKFLSTLSLRRATGRPLHQAGRWADFYPRSPCGERPIILAHWGGTKRFLSTLSLRRATSAGYIWPRDGSNFYPRSPCGERLQQQVFLNTHLVWISIHALLAESDQAILVKVVDFPISIHALLAESDRKGLAMRWNTCISIHALLAESDARSQSPVNTPRIFLSTLSLRRATQGRRIR